MKNVFVFPCGSEIGLEINRALAHSTYFTLFGGSSVDDHGQYVYQNYIPVVTHVDSIDFIDEINSIVEKYNIDFLVPAHDSVVLKWAEHQDKLKATVITSSIETCRMCRSKLETYELFNGIVETPEIFESTQDLNFPVFLKPDVGQGSKGTYKVNSVQEINFYTSSDPSLVIMEYLPGKEYTVDCFTDKHGKLLFAEGRERCRLSNGISVNSKKSDNPDFKKIAELINQKISLQGAWFYQVKERSSGELVLMEIAPRIAGTMALFRASGINFMQLTLFDRMGVDVSVMQNTASVEIDRALISRFSLDITYDCIYIDYDDTIIVNNKVNTEMMRLLYQAKNDGVKIVLITKHIGDLQQSLSDFSISPSIFDDIHILDKSDKKSAFIKSTNSIFIDDSFAERKDVFEKHGIPVFGVDAIESLLNWKN